jgi:hypothetical protein
LLPAFDQAATLIILPCSKRKARGGSAIRASGIADELPADLRTELLSARERTAQWAKHDDSRLLPAWQRYTGECYRTEAVEQSVATGAHVLIISGGYGIVLATEPIGWYDRPLHLRDWPGRLLERCLEVYARRQGLQRGVAFLARTGNYIKVVRQWAGTGVEHAYLVFPDTAGARIPQNLVASAYGEALGTFLQGKLRTGWSSEADVHVCVEQLK